MTDFTPGPWKVVGTHQNRILARFDGPNDNEHHTEIATVLTGQMSSSYSAEMGDANARLIAAAPDLYDACESLIEAMVDYEMDVCDEPPYRHRKMMHKARAALAKARGES